MKIEINPKKELFRWGPIDGRLIYADFFNTAFIGYAKKFFSWPDLLGMFYKGKMIYLADDGNLRLNGQKNFKQYILNDRNFIKYYRRWNNWLKDLIKIQRSINLKYLRSLDNRRLNKFYQNWAKVYDNFWVYGLLPEIANWGAEQILKEELVKLMTPVEFIKVFEKLAAPEKLSFYQKAEQELLRLAKYKGNGKLLEKKLSQYQQSHFWLLNSYQHTRVLSQSYFKKELLSLAPVKTQQRIALLDTYAKRVNREKARVIKKYQLDPQIVKVAQRLSYCLWWQDYRKFYIFWANHCLDVFLREFSERYKVNFEDLHFYNAKEVSFLAQIQKKLSAKAIKSRKSLVLSYYSQTANKMDYITGERARAIYKKFIVTGVKLDIVRELRGLVVSAGKIVRSRVKIITSPNQIKKMNNGDILIAAMTSPDYILAIKKASAMVTDAGGMTSHAAIVARELGIPCLVGTKLATKMFKDGDLAEVNPEQGFIRLIKGKKYD